MLKISSGFLASKLFNIVGLYMLHYLVLVDNPVYSCLVHVTLLSISGQPCIQLYCTCYITYYQCTTLYIVVLYMLHYFILVYYPVYCCFVHVTLLNISVLPCIQLFCTCYTTYYLWTTLSIVVLYMLHYLLLVYNPVYSCFVHVTLLIISVLPCLQLFCTCYIIFYQFTTLYLVVLYMLHYLLLVYNPVFSCIVHVTLLIISVQPCIQLFCTCYTTY